MNRFRLPILPLLVLTGVIVAVSWAARSSVSRAIPTNLPREMSLGNAIAEVDRKFDEEWSKFDLEPSALADDLTVFRRLSLALHGTIPSLEEIRRFESDDKPDRLTRWTLNRLRDRRFADYFAERLARSFVGTEDGQFVLYRRDRFVNWLSQRLRENEPYNEIVKRLIATDGLWTGDPATNFLTAAFSNDEFDEEKLASRTVRAFLGQSMDCAQCHDHPFDKWTQPQFQGLASFYGHTQLQFDGVRDFGFVDGEPLEYMIEDRETLEQKTISPAVPFGEEWLPAKGSRRDRLAAWITHAENRRFERAIVNRVWGLLFGRPLVQPVDDMPDPSDEPDLLDILGRDFREHNYDLRRLILTITSSKPFRLASTHSETEARRFWTHEEHSAVFPVTRLRPEQVIGSMLQAASVKTIDQQSNLLVRTVRFFREQDFVRDFGDAEGDELAERAGTVSQTLLRMNGNLPHELTKATPLSSVGRIAHSAGTNEECLDVLFLVCLTRRPTEAERTAMLAQLEGQYGNNRARAVEDLAWALLNCEEFSWNH
ncbi:DUF1549 domain-containing protein [Thalassoroseus pseudoceratinae]|uniref:DUF1549 domain-containing protein n=1 Tax=Thalassoroseus pseudoceratinae TaxID=2713176 RepID=UPI001F0F5B30|nr:DUF1549 domain-containing protein [Thalassoroseus pseudoceratinae]